MSTDWLVCVNLVHQNEREPSSDELLRWLFRHGLRPTEDGTTGPVKAWTELSDSGMPSTVPFDSFIKQIDESSSWYFTLWMPDEHLPLEITFNNMGGSDGVPDVPNIQLSVPKARFQPAPTVEAAEERANRVVELASELAEYLSAVYGFGGVAAGEWEREKKSVEKTLGGELSSMYWFNYYSEGLFEDPFKERILSGPADLCKTTGSGSIVLVPHMNPIENEGKRGEVIEYLGL
jgi:hypothetical protein